MVNPGGKRRGRILTTMVALIGLVSGCTEEHRQNVVVYSSQDREFSDPILKRYQDDHEVTVETKFDIESTKTIGLTTLLIAEAKSGEPRCDLFWNNEILNTLRLQRQGLLQPFHPAHAENYPAIFKANDGTWYGFAARARILLVNTQLVPEADRPASLNDLIDPKWKGKIGIAKPLAGTTATHAACLFAAWGPEKARAFFSALKKNEVNVLSGNKQVATAVGTGAIAFGLTDTDDAMGEILAGQPVAIVYPDRQADQLGTLFIPNTLCTIQGAKHPREAEALAGYLLSPEVESILAKGPSAQIPLGTGVAAPRIETPRTVHPMPADWNKAVDLWDEVASYLAEKFAG